MKVGDGKVEEGGEEVYRCDSGEGEDMKDFLMRCYAWNGERMVFF